MPVTLHSASLTATACSATAATLSLNFKKIVLRGVTSFQPGNQRRWQSLRRWQVVTRPSATPSTAWMTQRCATEGAAAVPKMPTASSKRPGTPHALRPYASTMTKPAAAMPSTAMTFLTPIIPPTTTALCSKVSTRRRVSSTLLACRLIRDASTVGANQRHSRTAQARPHSRRPGQLPPAAGATP
eukprot:scaffold56206_cov74-Phaeocystis_antarctica.AAC.4